MNKEELIKTLKSLKEERLDKYRAEGYKVDKYDSEAIYDLDDGDNLIQGIDILLYAIDK